MFVTVFGSFGTPKDLVDFFSFVVPHFVVVWSVYSYRVPTRTGKPGKPGKMGGHFPVREKSGNFEQTGKVRENHTKYWKTQGISDKYYFLFFSDI